MSSVWAIVYRKISLISTKIYLFLTLFYDWSHAATYIYSIKYFVQTIYYRKQNYYFTIIESSNTSVINYAHLLHTPSGDLMWPLGQLRCRYLAWILECLFPSMLPTPKSPRRHTTQQIKIISRTGEIIVWGLSLWGQIGFNIEIIAY